MYIHIKYKVFPPNRQTGIGVSSMLARIGGVLAPMINLLGETNSAAPTVIFGFTPLLGAALALGLPETANKPLPDTIQDIQDAERLVHTHDRAGQYSLIVCAVYIMCLNNFYVVHFILLFVQVYSRE